ncbi:MAG: hypothetical protein R3F62_03860 [Planctomycetota bacterium]
MTQEERNRKVHEAVALEYRSLSQQERIQRLIDCGILTKDGKLAPRYGGEDESEPDPQEESKAS